MEGDVPPGEVRPVQRPLSDLEPLLRAILDDDGIVSFGWQQYTPYFNDGDRCVFEVDEPWFRTTADPTLADGEVEDEDGETEDEFLALRIHPTLSGKRYDRSAAEFVPVERDSETIQRWTRCQALADAFASGAFDDVLLDAFGDHVHVRISRSGIIVDSYEHD
ncbi:hypothetical protein [Plantactinospora sp. GCM10030261]|uniref:hypothetical protein n=1 Tax=Plantactinospora sp. GCM10030261 TaxID=3273420 RepID=UPI003620093C